MYLSILKSIAASDSHPFKTNRDSLLGKEEGTPEGGLALVSQDNQMLKVFCRSFLAICVLTGCEFSGHMLRTWCMLPRSYTADSC